MTSLPRISTPEKEGQLRGSKAIKFQVLFDENEMEELLRELQCQIFVVSQVVGENTAQFSLQAFLEKYKSYIQFLKNGIAPPASEFRSAFSSVFTSTSDILYAQQVGSERYLIKPLKPVVQLQAHHFFHSDLDGKYHPQVLSDESISWGLQFSYPQIYQDPKNSDYSKVIVSEDFPNSALFLKLSKWIRKHSVPTPFSFQGKKTYVPIRIGKGCLKWIAGHPQLMTKRIEVCV